MKKIICLVMLLLCAPGAYAQSAEADIAFNGDWVVDIETSQKINTTLSQQEETLAFMGGLVMTLDMQQGRMALKSPDYDSAEVIDFTVISRAPGQVAIKMEDSQATVLLLTLQGDALICIVQGATSNRDDFVFVRPGVHGNR